jgi:hypothetical protein
VAASLKAAYDSKRLRDLRALPTTVSKQTTYEDLKTSSQRWHGDITDIVDQQ